MTKDELKKKVVVDELTKCWVWQGSFRGGGYAQCSCKDHPSRIASRAVYTMYKGSIPTGLVVMHRCDNPKCVNPKHLKAGTMSENTQDMLAKRRNKPEAVSTYMKAKYQNDTEFAARQRKQLRESWEKKYKEDKDWAAKHRAMFAKVGNAGTVAGLKILRAKWQDPEWVKIQRAKISAGIQQKKAKNGD